jgi:hypothetical protein
MNIWSRRNKTSTCRRRACSTASSSCLLLFDARKRIRASAAPTLSPWCCGRLEQTQQA